MEHLTLHLPGMWGDHHVLSVRKVLQSLGIKEIEASAARQDVRFAHDPATLSREEILRALVAAGFDPGATAGFPKPLANRERGSAWFVAGARVTQTNPIDH